MRACTDERHRRNRARRRNPQRRPITVTQRIIAPITVGDRVLDYTLYTATSWKIDARGVTPELPHMAMHTPNSSTVTTSPVAQILVERTNSTRRRGLRITLTGGTDDEETDERPITTFGNGSGWRAAHRTADLPQRVKDLISE